MMPGLHVPDRRIIRPKRKLWAAPPFGLGLGLSHVYPSLAPPSPPIAGYTIWLDATDSSNTASTWFDQSGNGHNAVTVGSDPTLVPGAINGLQAYEFNGSTQAMILPSLVIPANLTVFVVFQMITSNASDGLVDARYDAGFYMQYASSAPGQCWYASAESTAPSAPADTNTHVLAMSHGSSGTFTAYLDGTLAFTQTGVGNASGTNNRYLAYAPFSRSAHFNGYLCEYVEYSASMSAPQIASMQAYFSAKWM